MLLHGLLRIPSIPVCDAAETTGIAQHSRKNKVTRALPNDPTAPKGRLAPAISFWLGMRRLTFIRKLKRDLSMANSQSMAVSYSKDYQVKL